MVYTRLKYTIYDVYEIWVYEIGFTVIGRYTELKVYEMSRHRQNHPQNFQKNCPLCRNFLSFKHLAIIWPQPKNFD